MEANSANTTALFHQVSNSVDRVVNHYDAFLSYFHYQMKLFVCLKTVESVRLQGPPGVGGGGRLSTFKASLLIRLKVIFFSSKH